MKPALFCWPWATMLTGSSWAAIGAVRHSPTIVCTNERRETRPALTCSSSLRISCSSIGASATYKDPDPSSALRIPHPSGGRRLLRRRLNGPWRKSITRSDISHKRIREFEVRTAGRPVRTARTLAKRGGRGFGEGQVKKMPYDQAWELVREEWAFLPEE